MRGRGTKQNSAKKSQRSVKDTSNASVVGSKQQTNNILLKSRSSFPLQGGGKKGRIMQHAAKTPTNGPPFSSPGGGGGGGVPKHVDGPVGLSRAVPRPHLAPPFGTCRSRQLCNRPRSTGTHVCPIAPHSAGHPPIQREGWGLARVEDAGEEWKLGMASGVGQSKTDE